MTPEERALEALEHDALTELPNRTRAVFELVLRILRAALDVEQGLSGQASLALLPSLTDIRDHLASLVPDGFVSRTGWDRLRDVERTHHMDVE